jgi:hypothetical protein
MPSFPSTDFTGDVLTPKLLMTDLTDDPQIRTIIIANELHDVRSYQAFRITFQRAGL